MATITSAKQSGKTVVVYGDRGSVIFSRPGDLIGYTSTTVSIETSGGTVVTYNERGNVLYSR